MLSRLVPASRATVSRRLLPSKILATRPSPSLTNTTHTPLALRLSTSTTTRFSHRTYATHPMAAQTDTSASAVQDSTGITPATLSATLKTALDATHVEIYDISGGCGSSFEALIVSPKFQGKTLLARSRLVNAALKKEIAAIHAWTPRCLTPEQWEVEKEKGS